MPRFIAVAVALTSLCFGLADPDSVLAVTLSPGDIVVAGLPVESGPGALFHVDPVTGDRTIISSGTVGIGANIASPFGVFLDTDGTLLVSDQERHEGIAGRVIRVDPLTGNRTVISGTSGSLVVGTGPDIFVAGFVDLDPQGRILLPTKDGVLRIDPLSGDRTLLSGVGAGNGPAFGENVVGIDQDADGTILVSTLSPGAGAIFRVDPKTGDRSIVSDSMHGSGPVYLQTGIVVQGNSIFAATLVLDLARIDAMTGDRATVSGNSVGVGPSMGISWGVATEQSSDLLVSQSSGQIIRVDPLTGNRTMVSGSGVGNGPAIGEAYGILVVPNVPEPATIVLFAIALLGFVTHVARRRE